MPRRASCASPAPPPRRVLLLRVVVVLVAIALGVCVAAWTNTRERRWLRYAWTLFKVALAVVLAFLLLLFGERLLAL